MDNNRRSSVKKNVKNANFLKNFTEIFTDMYQYHKIIIIIIISYDIGTFFTFFYRDTCLWL